MVTRPDRPNLLIVWTDEQRADTMACYGNDYVQTPNLNQFAEQAFVFDQAYCCQPVCTPSRGCIMTGTYPNVHGAIENNEPLRADVKTIAELVPSDYRRAYHGKWHLGDEIIAQRGFDEWISSEDGIYRQFYSKPEYLERRSSYHHYLVENGFPPDTQVKDGARCFSRGFAAVLPYRFTKAGFLAKETASFLDQHDGDQPFLLSVSFLEPHMPFFGPYNDAYTPAELPVDDAFNVSPDQKSSLRNQTFHAKYAADGFHGFPANDAGWRRLRANYFGLMNVVDNAVGEILDALERSGLADSTIVVFTSDHGEMMGDHSQIGKGIMYEEAVRIPWLIRVPWLSEEQQLIPGRISQIDMVPTLLDLLGQPIPEELAGVSRAPVLEGKETLAENDVVVIWRGHSYDFTGTEVPGIAADDVAKVRDQDWITLITHDGWKLCLCATDPYPELFDLTDDPHELTNLYTDPAQQGRVADLTARIEAWQARHGYTDIALPA